MDKNTRQKLIDLTTNFYNKVATSFSNTRNNPWEGWHKLLDYVKVELGDEVFVKQKLSVYDLAAGNLRFEEFLREQFPDVDFDFHALDNCEALLPTDFNVSFQNYDLLTALNSGSFNLDDINVGQCNLVVAFGFMHHVPGIALQKKVLDILLSKTKSGGLIAVTFWQFMRDERRQEKHRQKTQEAVERFSIDGLGDNDYIIGWQDETDAYRYAQNFSREHIDSLIEHVKGRAHVLDQFNADGRTRDLNHYLILQKR